jgi:hypothetical protein
VVALGAEAPAVGLGQKVALLIEEVDVIDLLDGAAGEACLVLDDVLQPGLGRDRIVAPHDLVPRPVGARPHGVHARQAADIARDDAAGREQEAWQRDDVAILCLRRILGHAPQRIVIADAVRVVADVVARGLVAPWLGGHADLHADALAQLLQSVFGDLGERALGGVEHHPSFFKSVFRLRARDRAAPCG